MSKITPIIISCILSLLILSTIATMASAEKLEIERIIQESDIQAGGKVTVLLRFTNPFNKSIPVKIQDKIIFGQNGVDIECIEGTIPQDPVTTVSYGDPVQVFFNGTYTLEPAKVTYTNPKTGEEETVESNYMNVTVKGKNPTGTIVNKIDTIYRCDGIQKTTTQMTTSSSSSQQQNQQNQQQNQQNPQQNQQQIPQDQTQKKVNNMQQNTNQDMDSLKKQIQKQMQEEEEAKNQLRQNIEADSKFQDMQQELKSAGYQLEKKEVSPSSNNSGEFDYKYSKNDPATNEEKTANIFGNMRNKTIENMEKWSTEDTKQLQEQLEQNKEFTDMENQLKKEGYNLTDKHLSSPYLNKTNIDYRYAGSENKTARITGRIDANGTVSGLKIKREGEEDEQKGGINWIHALIALIVLIVLFFIARRIHDRKGHGSEGDTNPKKENAYFDFRKKAYEMIQEEEEMYKAGDNIRAY